MSRLPSLFVSHGAPTFAMEPGIAGPLLQGLGRRLARPRAVLVVSPHWMTRELRVATTDQPATVHDFGGFPAELYTLQYPAPGAPEVARRTLEVLAQAGLEARADAAQGMDHGAWVPLRYLYPDADVPVFQVSLPAQLDADGAWALGQALAPLADEGVLVVGSGSLTHNLREIFTGDTADDAYARAFVGWVRAAVAGGDSARLRCALDQAPHAARAHPTTEHFLPLLVAAGASGEGARAEVLDGGMTYGVLSMDAFVFAGA